jgi:hypothetical protein
MIPGTNMWIGTGVYIDNIDAYKAQMAEEIGSMVSKRTTTMVIVSGVIFCRHHRPVPVHRLRHRTGIERDDRQLPGHRRR